MLSFALVFAGSFDGQRFQRPESFEQIFYRELKPISEEYQEEALRVNGLNRALLLREGRSPEEAMTEAALWVKEIAGDRRPVLVAYPLSFDWTWLYWYFVRFSTKGSPFNHSGCFDIKTAYSVKSRGPIAKSGRDRIERALRPSEKHCHTAREDAIGQAEIFCNLFEWERD